MFSNDEELVNFFKSKFREEQYIIDQGRVYYDSQKASLGSDVNAFTYPVSGYSEVVVINFSNNDRIAVSQILKSMSNKDVANEIMLKLDTYFNGGDVEINVWTTVGNYRYKFIDRSLGAEVRTEKI